MMDGALYENAPGEADDHYNEAASFDPHFAEGEYRHETDAAMTADDIPHYELDLGQ
jgi:hypothetical protein